MNLVFADTVGLLALWDRSDQWHELASTAFNEIIARKSALITTTYVLLECGNASARRPYRLRVNALRQKLDAAGSLIQPTEGDWNAAWEAYQRSDAAGAGIVDQVSFVVMRRLGIRSVFTRDKHFVAAGFESLF